MNHALCVLGTLTNLVNDRQWEPQGQRGDYVARDGMLDFALFALLHRLGKVSTHGSCPF